LKTQKQLVIEAFLFYESRLPGRIKGISPILGLQGQQEFYILGKITTLNQFKHTNRTDKQKRWPPGFDLVTLFPFFMKSEKA
jgi:hypothetical protein